MAGSVERELEANRRLACAGRTGEERRGSLPQSAVEHLVKIRDTDRHTFRCWLVSLGESGADKTRIDVESRARYTECVRAFEIAAATKLVHTKVPLVAIAEPAA